MARKQHPYFSSKKQILSSYSELFIRPYRYVILGKPVEQVDKKKHPLYLYQENIIIKLDDTIFTVPKLLKIFQKALEDLVFILKSDENIMDFEFSAILKTPLFLEYQFCIFFL